MAALLVLLVPFPLGFFLATRTTAVVAYVAAFAPLFAFQTLNLIIEWVQGSEAAFGGPFPDAASEQVVGYGAVNLILYLVGFGLILLGHRLGAGRRSRRVSRRPVNLDPVG